MKAINDSTPWTRVFRLVLCLLLSRVCLPVISVWAADTATMAASASSKVFNVREFGAKGDGKTLDTAAIQKALDECGNAGGGTVQFPSGTYLSKPVFLRSNTTVELDTGAVLQATDETADFVNPERTNSFIAFVNGKDIHDVAIVGPGTID